MKFWEKVGVKLARLSIFLFQKNRIKANYFQIILVLITILYISFTTSVLINQRKNEQKIDNQAEKIEDILRIIRNNNQVTPIEVLPTPTLTPTIMSTIVETPIPTPTPAVLGSETSTYIGVLEVKPEINANIYENPTLDSVIINTATPSALLFYTKKEANWYEVNLADQNKNGWVPIESVNELIY